MAATRKLSVFRVCLSALILLVPTCVAQFSGNSDAEFLVSSPTENSGFGYELLRSQLEDVQTNVLEIQQSIAKNKPSETLEANVATILDRLNTGNQCESLQHHLTAILNRLEQIENRLNQSPHLSIRERIEPNQIRRTSWNRESISNFPRNHRREYIGNLDIPTRSDSTLPDIAEYNKVYDSCDDVPSSGIWRIRSGFQITNMNCIKF